MFLSKVLCHPTICPGCKEAPFTESCSAVKNQHQSKQLNSLAINKNMSGKSSTLVSIALKAKYETAGKPLFAFFNCTRIYFSDGFQVVEFKRKVN